VLLAAAARDTPPELFDTPGARLEHQARALHELMKSGRFRGKRAVCTVSAAHTIVQHIQITKQEGRPIDPLVHEELSKVTGRDASQFILRHTEVGEVTRGGAKRTEVICLAMPREAVISHMKALNHARLEAVGIHAEHTALVKSLESLGVAPDSAQVLIDLGSGTTKVAVSCAGLLRLAKVLSIGGRQFFRVEAKAPPPPANSKLALRAQLEALADSKAGTAVLEAPPAAPAQAALDTAAVDALADEIAQCVRYYHALTPDKKIERAIFIGGDAARPEICKRIARALGVPAQVGDPMNALARDPALRLDGVSLDTPTPEWALALGLSSLPTEA
jgi:Tfp pilus assembly PilM family ATPase